jgi:hypothetical protein
MAPADMDRPDPHTDADRLAAMTKRDRELLDAVLAAAPPGDAHPLSRSMLAEVTA